ncbi:VCBS repeat-containing protein [Actinoplanes sp. L3-i22]|uniref:VCBS repeat-containing protein n=1 Tax=Actinoplanes sp. L3-i22 TaxID=2836373 RepID=UPI001C7867F1|nr:VCBS repeat-containing protein [Actinoplanes sp. L3-i22]BCY15260.1 hypothetical protein L3i22_103480 [Actinoplanes sp. L3-i22]
MSTKRRAAHLLLAGLTATTVWSTVLAAPVQAADVTTAAAGVVADPTNLATDEDKVKAAAAIGVNPDIEMLLADDQAFVLALWRNAKPDSYVQAEALRAYDNADPQAAYQFITVGVFAAAADDAQAEIAAEHAKALRRSVLVTIGLDPADTALVDLTDLNFIIAVWQRVEEGSFVQAAAAEAIKGTQADWTTFLTTGAATARAADIDKQLKDATEAEAARIRAEQLAAAKKSLLQLLLLPVTQELIDAPNRQFVLSVHSTAKGTEVVLAAQAALNAADADLDKALSDFIFTDGAAANTKDEQAAAAKELAAYRTRVTAIRDAAVVDGWLANVVAAANQALATNTLFAVQNFVLKGQDEAHLKDKKSWASVSLSVDRVGVLTTDGVAYVKDGTPTATSWVNERTNVKQLVLAGDRIGVLTTDGEVYVKDGALSAGWVKEHTGIKQLAMAGDRIGVLTTGGIAYVKEGGLSAAWLTEQTGVQQLALTTNRIGVLTTGGIAYVKEGGLSTAWVSQRTLVKQMSLTTTRIGLLGNDGTAWVKEGAITGTTWVNELGGVKQLALTANRIGALTTGGVAWVKDGGLSAGWVNEEDNVVKLALDGDRIAVLFADGTTSLKDGGLSAAWNTQLAAGPLS